MTKRNKPSLILVMLMTTSLCLLLPGQWLKAQTLTASGFEKDRGHDMINIIKSDLKKNYYDPSFHGMDIDARFRKADEEINHATSIGHIFGIIAQALIELEDSHTFFLPPGRSARTEYGFEIQMIGDRCLVTAVQPGSDAAAKGLKSGDEIWQINDFGPTRENFWK